MKVLSCFAKIADKEKFRKNGYFTTFMVEQDESANVLSEKQREHIESVYNKLCALDKLPSVDLEVSLSSGMSTYTMVENITNMLLPILEIDSESIVVNLTVKFYDVISRTYTTHKDRLLVSYTISPLKVNCGVYRAEYSYMVKMYLAEILEKCVTPVSVKDIMDMLRLED